MKCILCGAEEIVKGAVGYYFIYGFARAHMCTNCFYSNWSRSDGFRKHLECWIPLGEYFGLGKWYSDGFR